MLYFIIYAYINIQLCFTREIYGGGGGKSHHSYPCIFFVHEQGTSNQNAFLFLFTLLCILLLMARGFEDFSIEEGPQSLYTSIISTWAAGSS